MNAESCSGCYGTKRAHHLMCGQCWSMVPKPLRAEVMEGYQQMNYATRRDDRRAGAVRYRLARTQAFAAVRRKRAAA